MRNSRQSRKHHPRLQQHHRQKSKPARHVQPVPDGPEREVAGVVDLLPTGVGFLRQVDQDLAPSNEDSYLSANFIQESALQSGMFVKGIARGNSFRSTAPAVTRILEINGSPVDNYKSPLPFDKQISIDPHERFILTPARTSESERSLRFMELMTPIGKGQRALIVAPPKTGKTTLLHDLASSIADHHPETFLIVLLVDERPEEVTHFKRSVSGTVIASSSDKEAASHMRVARLTLDMARNLSQGGRDVFLLLDSITRLGRASNREGGSHGKTLSGGMGSRALEFPRRFFGSARKLENGGSLTIVATALIDTGSRMDEVIFQEFKGTGNMEIVLDRRLSDRRIFPAVDLNQSGTRKEEKILPSDWLAASQKLRRHLSTLPVLDAMQVLLERLAKAESTQAFCTSLA